MSNSTHCGGTAKAAESTAGRDEGDEEEEAEDSGERVGRDVVLRGDTMPLSRAAVAVGRGADRDSGVCAVGVAVVSARVGVRSKEEEEEKEDVEEVCVKNDEQVVEEGDVTAAALRIEQSASRDSNVMMAEDQ